MLHTFPDDPESLPHNPGMGWVLYVEALDDGFPDPETYWAQVGEAWKSASTLYLRLEWSRMEPEEGRYAWNDGASEVSRMLAAARMRGLRLAFRVLVDSMHAVSQSTPDWVRRAGAQGYEEFCADSGRTFWNPRADDPVFQEKLGQFIAAFGARFGDPNETAFIDANGLGWWGETNHLDCLDDAQKTSVYRWLTAAYRRAFPRILLGDQYQDESFSFALRNEAVQALGFLRRRDSLGSPLWFTAQDKAEANEGWPRSPLFAENCYHHLTSRSNWWQGDGFSSYRAVLERVFNDALEVHANTLDLRIPDDAQVWHREAPDLVERFRREGGYRIRPFSVEVEDSVSQETPGILVRHRWVNEGVGRLPGGTWQGRFQVAFAAFAPGQESPVAVVRLPQIDPGTWLGGSVYEYEDHLPGVPGAFDLGVALVDTWNLDQPGIVLPCQGRVLRSGWLVVGR